MIVSFMTCCAILSTATELGALRLPLGLQQQAIAALFVFCFLHYDILSIVRIPNQVHVSVLVLHQWKLSVFFLPLVACNFWTAASNNSVFWKCFFLWYKVPNLSITEQIFRQNIGALKGKTTSRNLSWSPMSIYYITKSFTKT